jgi:putative endonuclease
MNDLAMRQRNSVTARQMATSGARRPGGRTAELFKKVSLTEKRRRYQRGLFAEVLAAALLMLKGYRILARRHRTRLGEIDLIAVRGRRLAFVEVKHRRTVGEATQSIGERQTQRVAAAAEQWVWQHPAYRAHEIGLDAVVVAPGHWPRHLANALQSW